MRTVTKIMIIGTAALAAGAFIVNVFVSDPFYWRDVQGKIVVADKRTAAGENGPYEKIALRLSPYEAGDVVTRAAAGASGLEIECTATKCATLRVGDCAKFSCKHIFRLWEPDAVDCKLDRTIVCN